MCFELVVLILIAVISQPTYSHDDTIHGPVRFYGRTAANTAHRNFNLLDILSQKGLGSQSSPTIEVIQNGDDCGDCVEEYDEYDYCVDCDCDGCDDYGDFDENTDDDLYAYDETDPALGLSPSQAYALSPPLPTSSEFDYGSERKQKISKKTNSQESEDTGDDEEDNSDDVGDDDDSDGEERITDDNEVKDSNSENNISQVQSNTSQVIPRQQIRDEVQAVLNAVRRSDMLRREQAHRRLIRNHSKCKAEVRHLRRKLKYKAHAQRRRIAAAKRRAQKLRRRRQQKQKRRRNRKNTIKVKT
uniref:Uncharacterized protein n=1 Tax=Glossina brevipalpis TaxID=37001 RepID=A0A1A9WL53_9MUSC